VRGLLTSALFAAPLAYAAEPVVLHVGDQNYYNVRASVEASAYWKARRIPLTGSTSRPPRRWPKR
jgi:hypothetical protein